MMEATALSFNKSLIASLEQIRRDHPYPEEILKKDLDQTIIELIARVNRMSNDNLRLYADSIRNSQLELIFHALTGDIPMELKEKFFTILRARIKKRFFHYNWIILQEHYTNDNLIESFIMLTEFMKDKYYRDYESTLAGKINIIDKTLVHRTMRLIIDEKWTLDDFFQRYRIIPESKFARAVINQYFMNCDSPDYKSNALYYISLLSQPVNNLYPLVNRYLETVDVLEYTDAINYSIQEHYKTPNNDDLWTGIESGPKEKFLDWIRLKVLECYTGPEHEKFKFWRYYHDRITDVCYDEDLKVFFFNIANYTVVDINKDAKTSYLYKSHIFKYEYKLINDRKAEGNTKWLITKDRAIDIKDAIIDGIDSDVYRLSYERVGKLYIKDILG